MTTTEDLYSVNSPRRILSFSKRRRANVSLDFHDSRPGFGLSDDRGLKPSEVYGFVGSITTAVTTVIFLVWAYVPERWLHSIGIYYYPSRYWALAGPSYVIVTVLSALGFYIGLNFMSTPLSTSPHTLFDEFSRDPSNDVSYVEEGEQLIEPISDIGIDRVNAFMFQEVGKN